MTMNIFKTLLRKRRSNKMKMDMMDNGDKSMMDDNNKDKKMMNGDMKKGGDNMGMGMGMEKPMNDNMGMKPSGGGGGMMESNKSMGMGMGGGMEKSTDMGMGMGKGMGMNDGMGMKSNDKSGMMKMDSSSPPMSMPMENSKPMSTGMGMGMDSKPMGDGMGGMGGMKTDNSMMNDSMGMEKPMGGMGMESKSMTATANTMTSSTMPPPSSLTLLELFQSQGCSSCPPANANVISLSSSSSPSNVLILTYEVTYWDYLGWKDTFGNSEFDARQRDYVSRMGLRSAYTPQVIVNGRTEGVGNRKSELQSLLSRGTYASSEGGNANPIQISKLPPSTSSSSSSMLSLFISPSSSPSSSKNPFNNIDILLITYDPNTYDVDIKKGENRGRCLPHKNVVRSVKRVGGVNVTGGGGQRLDVDISMRSGNAIGEGLEAVVVAQDGRGGEVLGVCKV